MWRTSELGFRIRLCHEFSDFQLNLRSGWEKDDVSILFNKFGYFDLIMMTEIWYQNEDEVTRTPNETSFFVYRETPRGGGL